LKGGTGMGISEAAASGRKHFSVSLTTPSQQAPSAAATGLHMYNRKKGLLDRQTDVVTKRTDT